MPTPSLTEEAKLINLGLLAHYQKRRAWYVQQARLLVQHASLGAKMAATSLGINPVGSANQTFSQDEVAYLLRWWLINNDQWKALLQRKVHLPVNQYDVITDTMARYVAWSDYIPIITP